MLSLVRHTEQAQAGQETAKAANKHGEVSQMGKNPEGEAWRELGERVKVKTHPGVNIPQPFEGAEVEG